MKTNEIAKAMGLEVYNDGEREVKNGFVGDLMSLAMAKLGADEAWITVQTNTNAVAVASLADAACVILCEGQKPDADMLSRAKQQEIPVYGSDKSAYALAVELSGLI